MYELKELCALKDEFDKKTGCQVFWCYDGILCYGLAVMKAKDEFKGRVKYPLIEEKHEESDEVGYEFACTRPCSIYRLVRKMFDWEKFA